MHKTQASLIQAGLWLLFGLLLLTYNLQKSSGWLVPVLNAALGVVSYVVAVYANTQWLMPRYFQQKKYGQYGVWAVGLLALLIAGRMAIERELFEKRLIFHQFYGWNTAHFLYTAVTILLAFLFGFLLRIAFDYVSLLRQQERLRHQQAATELNLLKAQVQPHFLFNTLNNIYALALARSDDTPVMLAKLSDTIRYFVDEAPNDRVPLQTEVAFLRNYIELEQIRLRYPFQFLMQIDADDLSRTLPPMLLIPFVENVFKHGVDRSHSGNAACLHLLLTDDQLQYTVKNQVFNVSNGPWRGLANLQKRLTLLYPDSHELSTNQQDGYFYATLTINRP